MMIVGKLEYSRVLDVEAGVGTLNMNGMRSPDMVSG